ncbi:MAG: beta-lactamase family protein [Balneolaceae bacterium]|nr:beta-lactamase family protein [Balneolaceae bacterium]
MLLENYFYKDGPGAALAIVPDSGESLIECYGVSSLDIVNPINPETAFDLASVSKTFTATAVLLLQEKGTINLNEPISCYLSGLRHSTENRAVTIQDLLWHTSGIPDYLVSTDPDQIAKLTTEHVMEKASEWIVQVQPGMKHEYSNTNYVILAEMIKSVTGRAYADYVQNELFDRHVLTCTFVLSQKPQSVVRARGYQNTGFGLPRYELAECDIQVLGDGGIFSALSDLIRWQQMFFNARIFSKPTLAHALSQGRLDNGSVFNYGCGMIVEKLPDGRTWCGHNGGWLGVSSFLGRIVEDKISMIVLSNDQSAPADRIAHCAYKKWKEKR